MKIRVASLTAAALLSCAAPALAWGTTGHTMINRAAASALAGTDVPAFLKTPAAKFEIAFLGPEEDRLKGSGKAWDADYDPGHYVDLRDDGTVAGVVPFDALPATSEAYDNALHAAGTDEYRQGYLPYSILDGWEQLRKDFAYWRVDKGTVRAIDEQLIIRDIGLWGHFIADGSQPLHVTVHFNGWGKFPNPNGFTQSRETHAFFESVFIDRHARQSAVDAGVASSPLLPKPTSLLSQARVLHEIERYLMQTSKAVPQLYTIEKQGGFKVGSPQAVRFADARLSAGAAELRNLVLWAWQDSINESVGYPEKSVRDILSGKAKLDPGD